MDRVGIRVLRNNVAAVVRRAAAGERIVVTVDGVPTAQLGPLEPATGPTIDDLVASGLVVPPAGATDPARRPRRTPRSTSARAASSTSCGVPDRRVRP